MSTASYVTMMISIPAACSVERFRAMLTTFAMSEGCKVLPGGDAGLDFFLKREPGPTAADVQRVEQMADSYIARGMGGAVAKSGSIK